MRKLGIATAAALLLGAAAANAQQITTETLRAALSGNTVTFILAGGDAVNVYYAADGTAKLDSRGQRPFNDTGTWTVNGNQYCTKYQRIRAGHEACLTVEQIAAEDITVKDAAGAITQGKLRKGNAAGL